MTSKAVQDLDDKAKSIAGDPNLKTSEALSALQSLGIHRTNVRSIDLKLRHLLNSADVDDSLTERLALDVLSVLDRVDGGVTATRRRVVGALVRARAEALKTRQREGKVPKAEFVREMTALVRMQKTLKV